MTSISGMPTSLSRTPRHRCVASAPKHGMGSHKSCPYGSGRGPHQGLHHHTTYPGRGNPCGCPSPFTITNASSAAPQVAHTPPIWWLTAHPAESGLLRQAPRSALRIGAVAARHQQRDLPPGAQSAPGQRRRTRDAGQDRRTRRSLGDSAVQTAPPLPSASPPAERGERGTALFRGSLAVFGGRVLFAEGGLPAEVVLHIGVVAVLAEGQYVVWGREHAAEA